MKAALAASVILLAGLPSFAGAEEIWGVVCFDPSKGEMRGTRVILSGEAEKPEVVFQHCTGGCSNHRTVSASLVAGALQFEIASRADEARRASFSGRIRGNSLSLKGQNPAYGLKNVRLSRGQKCPRDTVFAEP